MTLAAAVPPCPAGTVCVLAQASERGEGAVQQVVRRYAEETGHQPKVFQGSSAGAAQFGHLRLRRLAAA